MQKVKITGVGIHSGLTSNLTIIPTKSGGIIFIKNGVRVSAKFNNVTDTLLRNTTIGTSPNDIRTIEHLMAALFVNRIYNAEIQIDNSETPILDGSAKEFIKSIKKLKKAGKISFLRIKKEIIVRQSEIRLPIWMRALNFIQRRPKPDGYIKITPVKSNVLDMTSIIKYKDKIIGDQSFGFIFNYDEWQQSATRFEKEVATSRTFGKISEWEWLKKRGMGRGANEHNVIALNEDGSATLNPLRFSDEFVRHKIIDMVGDLYTSGYFIIGRVESFKGGHALNNLLLRKIFENHDNYDIINKEINDKR
jgi:UDP-3-O-[3-hydroxymyristoyl] N-acetylglucosamine deacetylase